MLQTAPLPEDLFTRARIGLQGAVIDDLYLVGFRAAVDRVGLLIESRVGPQFRAVRGGVGELEIRVARRRVSASRRASGRGRWRRPLPRRSWPPASGGDGAANHHGAGDHDPRSHGLTRTLLIRLHQPAPNPSGIGTAPTSPRAVTTPAAWTSALTTTRLPFTSFTRPRTSSSASMGVGRR